MNIREAILEEHSKQQALMLTDYIGADQRRFDELYKLFLSDDDPVVPQRAAWVLGHCLDRYPFLIKAHLHSFIGHLETPGLHDAVRRNTVRILAGLDIPEEWQGMAATFCFEYLADPKEKAAIKVHSMQVLYNLCLQEPDLAYELQLLLEEQMETATAGFRSRGRKILTALQKLQSPSQ